MKRIDSTIPKDEILSRLKSGLEPWMSGAQGRFTGWALGGFFSVRYHGAGQRLNITNRRLGRITARGGKTAVDYMDFHGMTDPLSLVQVFLLSAVVLFLMMSYEDGFTGVSLPPVLLAAALITAAVAAITYLMAARTAQGRQNREETAALFARITAREADNETKRRGGR